MQERATELQPEATTEAADLEQGSTTVQEAGEASVRRIISPLGRLRGILPRDLYRELVNLKWSGQLEAIARNPTPADREALIEILRRFLGDMSPYRPRLELTFALVFRAIPDTDIALLCETLGARFGLNNVNDPTNMDAMDGVDSDALSAKELRRIWRTLERLPEGHVVNAAGFRAIVADNLPGEDGVGGHYVGEQLYSRSRSAEATAAMSAEERALEATASGTVAMTMDLEGYAKIDEQAREVIRELRSKERAGTLTPDERAMLAQARQIVRDGDRGRASFDNTLRHEIGHAVDENLGASVNYCLTPAGGGWRYFHDHEDEVLDTVLAASGYSAAATPELLVETKAFLVGALLHPATPPPPRPTMSTAQEILLIPVERMLQWGTDPAAAGGNPPLEIGGRVYFDSAYGWLSYNMEARARKVSDYQFSAPAEWFAEAYAAYYAPGRRGSRLNAAGDAATKRYFDEVVQPYVDHGMPRQTFGPNLV